MPRCSHLCSAFADRVSRRIEMEQAGSNSPQALNTEQDLLHEHPTSESRGPKKRYANGR